MPGNHEEHYTRGGGTVLLADDSFITFWTEERIIGTQGTDQSNPLQSVYYGIFSSTGELISEGNYLNNLDIGVNGSQAFRYFIYHVNQTNDAVILSGSNLMEGIILNIDFDGTLQWQRSYSPIENVPIDNGDSRTKLYGVYPSSDGGYLATGEFSTFPSVNYPDGIQTSILLKVDSMGCLDSLDCEPIGVGLFEDLIPEKGVNALRVYPNPTSGMLRVELPFRGRGQRGLRLEVLNQRGMVVSSMSNIERRMSNDEVELDLSDQPAGLYHIRLIADEGVWAGKVSLL